MDSAQATNWLQPSAAFVGMAIASIAILRARTCPWIFSLACWAALALCVATNLLPAVSAILLSLAVGAAVVSHRLPAGLTWALFAWLVSVAAGWTLAVAAGATAGAMPEVICHGSAGLALWWMVAARLTHFWSDRWANQARQAFLMTGAIMAIGVVVLLAYSAATVMIWRLNLTGLEIRPVYMPALAWRGLVDIALLIAALVAIRGTEDWTGWPAAMFWLVVFAGTWYSLRLPVSSPLTYSDYPEWLRVSLGLQTTLAGTLLGAVLIWVVGDWRRQARAWPDDLPSLVGVSKAWPGVEFSAMIVGLILIPLGLWHALSTGAGAMQIARLTTWEMVGAGVALSIFVAWRWNRTLAELSLALWTIALAALGTTTALQVATKRPSSIDELPIVQSGALLGLTVAGLLWFWLATFWKQQLRDGRPWTTAGRLIPLADRTGFLSAALAVLVAARLSIYPRLSVGTTDNSLIRLYVVSAIFLLLVGTCLYAARQTRRPTLLCLAGVSSLVWGLFLWMRV